MRSAGVGRLERLSQFRLHQPDGQGLLIGAGIATVSIGSRSA